MNMQPGPELDAKIAEAIGLTGAEPYPQFNLFRPETLRDFFRPFIGNAISKFEAYNGDGPDGNLYDWSPSGNLNDAFDAAEKCGLFNGNVSLVKSMRSWHVEECAETYGPTRPRRWSIGIGGTPALAICDAILTLTERHASSGSPSS